MRKHRDEDADFANIDDDTADPKMMPLVQQLIRQQTRHWDGKMVADPVQERLLEIIALKKKALRKHSKSQSKAAEPGAARI
ncbi:hypothetical protein AB4Z52_14635 [Rhizobium sp. 2YAF20]|uniref:hypothetical protein n=1 Tax=Rhizobium sp. 2YAF20 TaxID=3233027 RepID=UPI003F999CBE